MSVVAVGSTKNNYSLQSVGNTTVQAKQTSVTSSKSVQVTLTAKAIAQPSSTVADAVSAYQSAVYAGTLDKLGPLTISDASTNLQANFSVLADMAKNSKIATFALTDKSASISIDSQTLGNMSDKTNGSSLLLQKITSNLAVKVQNATIQYSINTKPPIKNISLQFSIRDNAQEFSTRIDALNSLVKSKGLVSSISLISNSTPISLNASQLQSSAITLSYLAKGYSLNINDVAMKDFDNLSRNSTISKLSIKDSASNILTKIETIESIIKTGRIGAISLTDTVTPELTVDGVRRLKATLASVASPSGFQFNLADSTSNLVSLARFDQLDLINNASTVRITDKKPQNLSIDDAKVLKTIKKIATPPQYNILDSKDAIASQAAVDSDGIITNAIGVTAAQTYTVAQYTAVSKTKGFDKKTPYIIQDTSKNIINQANVGGESLVKNASSLIIKDTSSNIVNDIVVLNSLAKKQSLLNVNLLDSDVPSLNLLSSQIASNANLLGRITTQFNPGSGVGFVPGNSIMSLRPWSAPTTVPVKEGAYNFRTYSRNLVNGSILSTLTMDPKDLLKEGTRSAELYLTVEDALGNLGQSIKVADVKTVFPQASAPKNGGVYTINFRGIVGGGVSLESRIAVNNQAIIWMDLQNDGTYSIKARTYEASALPIVWELDKTGINFTSDEQVLVSGISPNVTDFTWTNINANNSNNIALVYETADDIDSSKKNVFCSTFAISSDYKTFSQLSSTVTSSGANAGAIRMTEKLNRTDVGNLMTNPNNGVANYLYTGERNGSIGLYVSNLSSQAGLSADSRFLSVGSATKETKITNLQMAYLSDPSSQSTFNQNLIVGIAGTEKDSSSGLTKAFVRLYKLDPALIGDEKNNEIKPLSITSMSFDDPTKGLWVHNINSTNAIWSFQNGSTAHLVQVDGNGKILADDQVILPNGAVLDRMRNINSGIYQATNTNLFDLLWRENDQLNSGANILKHQLYDIRDRNGQNLNDIADSQYVYIAGTAGDDIIKGRETGGRKIFSGGGGNDTIIGGKDYNFVSYTGNYSDYKIQIDAQDTKKIIVQDTRIGSPDGTDILYGIFSFRFADKTIDSPELLNI